MKAWFCLLLVALLSSCASSPRNLQSQVNGLVINQNFNAAIQKLEQGPLSYGSRNQLLYWLDRGYILHLSGQYQESIIAFEKAKKLFNELYGRSLTQATSTVIVNDNWDHYRGEDHEYVLINIFQALNFVLLGNIEEALVEARDVERKLKAIDRHYDDKVRNVYRQDAFAQLLMGLLYEIQGSSSSLDDARICYTKALEIYHHDYLSLYGVGAPEFLKERLSRLGQRSFKAEVFLIEYTGFSPVKVEENIVIPLDATHLTRMSFPQYENRYSEIDSVMFKAKAVGLEYAVPVVIAQPIGKIAKQSLEQRKAWLIAKGLLRPGLKYAAQKVAEHQLNDHGHETAAVIVNILGNIYNLLSERADLRCWQSLPNEIRIGRLELDPGEYEFYAEGLSVYQTPVENKRIGKLVLQAGERRFIVVQSNR